LLKFLFFLSTIGFLVSSNALAANLVDQYKNQQNKSSDQKSKANRQFERELLKKVKKSVSDFTQTFSGNPRPIAGEKLGKMIKTSSTAPVGFLLDGPYILRLEGEYLQMPPPSYKRFVVPSLVVAAKILDDGTIEFLGKTQNGTTYQVSPHPNTVNEKTRQKINIYSSSGGKVYKNDLYLGEVFKAHKIVTKYFSYWSELKVHRNELPRSVVKYVGDFHAKQVDFCRYYFNQSRWPKHGDPVCRPW
jgi:hypothetical protein